MAAEHSTSNILRTSPLLQAIGTLESDDDDDLILDAHARLDSIEFFLAQQFGYNPDNPVQIALPSGGPPPDGGGGVPPGGGGVPPGGGGGTPLGGHPLGAGGPPLGGGGRRKNKTKRKRRKSRKRRKKRTKKKAL